MNKAIFLDRDGVINIEKEYLYKIEDFEFIDGVFKACKYFISKGYMIFIITNQSGIGRGYYSKHDFNILTQWMLNKFQNSGIKITDINYCPHLPTDGCKCRKPSPNMILDFVQQYNIDLTRSWLIGDKQSDIDSAINANIDNHILVKSGHVVDENKSSAKFILNSILDTIDIIN